MDYPCYVLHVKNGFDDREKSIIQQFAILKIAFEWILEHDIPEITDDILTEYNYNGTLKNSEISCCLKHITAWERIAKTDFSGGFVFEDDALIKTKMFKKITLEAIAEFERNWQGLGCLCLGDGCAMHVPWTKTRKGQRLYLAELARAADSYWVSRETATLRLQWLRKNGFALPADHLITKIDTEINSPLFWIEPTVVSQGSHTGRFRSTIQQEERGKLADQMEWGIKKIRRKYFYPLLGIDQRKMGDNLKDLLNIENGKENGS